MSDFKVKMHIIRFPLWPRPERGKKREEEGGSEGRAAPQIFWPRTAPVFYLSKPE